MFFPPEPKRPWYVRLWRWIFPIKIPHFTKVTLPVIRSGFPAFDKAGFLERRRLDRGAYEAWKLANEIDFKVVKKP